MVLNSIYKLMPPKFIIAAQISAWIPDLDILLPTHHLHLDV